MRKNKHLPGIPKLDKADSGQYIVELGTMQTGMLEELEKSHLYIAQLNDRIKALEARIEKPEKKPQK
ncbi:MAG: hypothetical protein AUJ75_04505 [Candidatus Omnitrophica bacterium CG1_02_49_10]|nr:MAG: hypothetical protein AUJ75_04505 [Candidatus Omnitrophica bacterium CG1_02_49_10]